MCSSTTLGLFVPFAVSPCSTKVRPSPCSSLFRLFELFTLHASCQGVVGSPAGAAGSPRSCPCIARARGRQPAAGEKNPVINEVFFRALVCVFLCCVRESRHQRRGFGPTLSLCQRFLFIASAHPFGVFISFRCMYPCGGKGG